MLFTYTNVIENKKRVNPVQVVRVYCLQVFAFLYNFKDMSLTCQSFGMDIKNLALFIKELFIPSRALFLHKIEGFEQYVILLLSIIETSHKHP